MRACYDPPRTTAVRGAPGHGIDQDGGVPGVPPVIYTPDRRLRVFVSSTLGELAEERAAARAAIDGLHLVPVMFELGARPHPPRELYRAYLAQSDVFVGIYGERYGWVAPGEAVSGLEDEYRLAGPRPRLLYLRQTDRREPRLADLVADFATDDLASYKHYASADELGRRLADDLAVLLSERFASTAATPDRSPRAALPAPPQAIVGREAEVAAVAEHLRHGSRLVTLTGMGGIGKTRLALEVARTLEGDGPTTFVDLSAVTDADRALRTVAEALGATADGVRGPLDAIVEHLRDTATLVVLDNLEQVVGIDRAVAVLLERAPDLHLLATSRRPLRVRAEREVRVPPLPVPAAGAPAGGATDEPCVALFLDRASDVGVELDDGAGTVAVVAEICRRLEGIPLAIELAAARTRVLPPASLLERLDDRLGVLVGGGADVPARQRKLRATIDWSHDLLDEDARGLLARLSVFAGGWTLEAAEAVCDTGDDLLEPLATLVDTSLVLPAAGPDGPPRFRMFETVRAYAGERLDELGEAGQLADRHLTHFRAVGEQAQPWLCGPGQREWVARLDVERPNLRVAVRHAVATGDHAAVVELTWDVIVLYFVRDAVDEPTAWLDAVARAEPDLDPITDAKLRSLHALVRIHHGDLDDVLEDLEGPLAVFEAHDMDFESAVALHQLGFVRQRAGDLDGAVAALARSSELFDGIGHDWGVALAEAMLASVLIAGGDLDSAGGAAQRSLDRARRIDNDQQVAQALHHLAVTRLLRGEHDEAAALLGEAATLARAHGLRTDACACLDVAALLALRAGDAEAAADAVGAAAANRQRLGVAPWPTLEPSLDDAMATIRDRLGDAEVQAHRRAAGERDLFGVLDATLSTVDAGSSPRHPTPR